MYTLYRNFGIELTELSANQDEVQDRGIDRSDDLKYYKLNQLELIGSCESVVAKNTGWMSKGVWKILCSKKLGTKIVCKLGVFACAHVCSQTDLTALSVFVVVLLINGYFEIDNVLCGTLVTAQNASVNCPTSTGTLFAYPEGDVYDFQYTFDPLFKTNIDLLDRWVEEKKTRKEREMWTSSDLCFK